MIPTFYIHTVHCVLSVQSGLTAAIAVGGVEFAVNQHASQYHWALTESVQRPHWHNHLLV